MPDVSNLVRKTDYNTKISEIKNKIISEWESKGFSNEKYICAYIPNVSVCPKLIWMNNFKIRLKFKGSCLKQDYKVAYAPKNVVNLFISMN